MKKSTRANLLLLLTALIWGLAFVAQDVAMDNMPPFAFNAARMLLAGIALIPVIVVMDKRAARAGIANAETGVNVPFSRLGSGQRRTLLIGSLCCGVMLTLGSGLQQLGIQQGASAGKAGFVTALYIVLVPVVGLLFGKRVRRTVWLAVALSAVGLYLLCIKDGFTVEPSDLSLILCALSFTGHILVVDHFSRLTDCVKMSCLQFLTTAVLCGMVSAVCENPTWSGLQACIIPILYAGVMSGAVGYTLQIVAQKDTEPAIASLIMCLESVFAVLAGWIILGDVLSVRELLGCLAMLMGIVIAQMGDGMASAPSIKHVGSAD